MAGDCSESPKLAVFVTYKDNSTDFKQVKIYVGGNLITIQASNDEIPIIEYEGQTIDIRNGSFQHQIMEDFYDFEWVWKIILYSRFSIELILLAEFR